MISHTGPSRESPSANHSQATPSTVQALGSYDNLTISDPSLITGGAAVMPGMVELGEDIFLKPVRKGLPTYGGPLFDMVANPRSATVMGLLEEARLARVRGQRVAQKNGSVKTAFGRFKDFIVGNF